MVNNHTANLRLAILAVTVSFVVSMMLSCQPLRPTAMTDKPISYFDWQGHRGARGLYPENTIPAFVKALAFPTITTLELDLAVSADGQLIVSHEPWMSADICSHPDGRAVTTEEAMALRIYEMTVEQIRGYDCGQRGNARFPEQQKMPVWKPTLPEVVTAAEQTARQLGRPVPRYNIEIKSHPQGDDLFTPPPARFVELVLAEVHRLGIAQRSTIQSFDLRTLEELHRQAPQQRLAYLVEEDRPLAEQLALLSFQPTIYSPYFKLLDKPQVDSLHALGIQVIPWTVNDTKDMETLISIGVDGIITDYPNRIPNEILKK
ncbi:MAG: glycerophosphodiester phosphodiesterase [Saprospiraceae bacterium]